jgi:hypothetical protein
LVVDMLISGARALRAWLTQAMRANNAGFLAGFLLVLGRGEAGYAAEFGGPARNRATAARRRVYDTAACNVGAAAAIV